MVYAGGRVIEAFEIADVADMALQPVAVVLVAPIVLLLPVT
jgi:hypothetical protein